MKDLFISITGFTGKSQVESILKVLEALGEKEKLARKLGVGVMMSHNTLFGLPSRYIKVFPPKEKIASIFVDHPLVFNVLHYADYQGIDITASLKEAARWGGENIQAIQLDMTWPDPQAIKTFRRSYPSIKLILQVGQFAFEQINDDQKIFVEKLKDYSDK